MPRVVIDLRMVEGPLHGIARYALELARNLPKIQSEWEFIGLTAPMGLPENLGPLLPDIRLVACRAGFLSPFEQPALAASLFKLKPDLFHATSFSVPRFWPGKLVATLHDANHLALKSEYGPLQAAYYRHIVAPRAERAVRLITISEFSRRELSKHLSLREDTFQVIAQGVDASFCVPTRSEVEAFKSKYQLPEKYFAVIGNSKRYKNLEILAKVRRPLVQPLVARAGQDSLTRMGNVEENQSLPSLSDSDLRLFYAGATALLFPSIYEGFGLPILEAMACGCPVISSNAGALPEVVSTHGTLVSPTQPEAWREAMTQMATDFNLRQRFAQEGLVHAAQFSWQACAEKTLRVYSAALQTG